MIPKKYLLRGRIKYLLLLIFTTASNIGTYCQVLQYRTGDKIVAYDEGTFKLHDMDSLYLYAFRNHYEAYYVDVYDRDSLRRNALIRIPLPSKDSIKYGLESLFIRNDTFQIFYSYFDKISKAEKLEMITFNRQGEKIGETKLIDVSEGKNEKKAGSFSVHNEKKLNEFISYSFKQLQDTMYINIDHFDYTGIKKRSQSFILEEEDYIIYSTWDEDYNLYHLTRNKRGNRDVTWNIRFYRPEAESPQIIRLKRASAERVYLSNFFMTYRDGQQRLNFITPYTMRPQSKYAEGMYIAQIDPVSHVLIKEDIVPFEIKGGDKEYQRDFSLFSCIPVAAIPLGNGRLRMVFESRLQTITKLYWAEIANEFEIGNIITVDLDANNSVTEIHKVKKDQNTEEGYFKFTGFAILIHAGKSYFIYNELPGNLQLNPKDFEPVTWKKISKTVVIYTSVDSNKVKRNILISKDPDSGTDAIIPGSYLRAHDKSEIYLLRKIKKDVFLTKIFITD